MYYNARPSTVYAAVRLRMTILDGTPAVPAAAVLLMRGKYVPAVGLGHLDDRL
jgi:hypothetical protein